MNEHQLISLGMFVNELKRLHSEYGFWLQGAEVHSLAQADPIAQVCAGGGNYCVTLTREEARA
jgi:hypothetical protein